MVGDGLILLVQKWLWKPVDKANAQRPAAIELKRLNKIVYERKKGDCGGEMKRDKATEREL